MDQLQSDGFTRRAAGKLVNQVPQSKPLGLTIIHCKCGRIHEIPSSDLLREGLACECGYSVEGRGDIFKRQGKLIMRRYSAGHDR